MKALSDKKEAILFRRSRIKELRAKGFATDAAIAHHLGCSRQTITSDLKVLRRQAYTDVKEFSEKLPFEYDSMMAGVRLLLKRNWETLDNAESSDRAKASASHIILSCYEKLGEQLKDRYDIMNGRLCPRNRNNS